MVISLEAHNKIEDKVFDAIDSVADELEIEIDRYPLVVCLDSPFTFDFSNVPEHLARDFKRCVKEKSDFLYPVLDASVHCRA
jgi:hypothetical protein